MIMVKIKFGRKQFCSLKIRNRGSNLKNRFSIVALTSCSRTNPMSSLNSRNYVGYDGYTGVDIAKKNFHLGMILKFMHRIFRI